jgi:hypothetical protein
MEFKMVKQFFIAVMFVLVVSPAIAGSCPAKVGKIDAALSSGSIQNAEEVKSLRDKGEALHKAGSHSESVATLVKAMKLAGVN